MALTTRVTTGELGKASMEFRDNATKYRGIADRILQYGKDLDSYWEGEAKDKFMAQVGTGIESLEKLYAIMTQYADALDRAAKEYERTEKENIDISSN